MLAIRQCVSRLEAALNSRLSYTIYHHSILGVLLIFVGIPMATFAVVCGTTSLVLALLALFFA